MSPRIFKTLLPALLLMTMLVACQPPEPEPSGATHTLAPESESESVQWRQTLHRNGDDLLTAGLGLSGLQRPAEALAPAPNASAESLRRLAIHNAWTSLAALNEAGGVGGLLQELPEVSGREFMTRQRLPGRQHPVRYLVQLPDAFDPGAPCLVAAPASGSRGVYGAIALAGAWGLPRGCAVVYTDKGAGTDFFSVDDQHGVRLDGRRAPWAEIDDLEVDPPAAPAEVEAARQYMPHAHSGDHPEADWGQHVLTSIRLARQLLGEEYGERLNLGSLVTVATGLSNGAGAALRAAEQDAEGLIDGVVAVMPNVTPPSAPHLYDYASLAALLQPCLLADGPATLSKPLGNAWLVAAGQSRCDALADAGWLDQATPEAARQRLQAVGFDDAALSLSAANVALDLWRSVLVSYASAYLRADAFDMPCGYGFAIENASPEQRQAWWASHSGIGAGSGIELVDGGAGPGGSALSGLLCLRGLFDGDDEPARQLRAAMDATLATAGLPDIPVLLVHGREDGLIPAAFSARAYVEAVREQGGRVTYWEVDRAQHFDALLAVPAVAEQLVPILPYGWRALDRLAEVLAEQGDLGGDRRFEPVPAVAKPQTWSGLGFSAWSE